IHFLLIRKKSHLEFNLKHFRFSWLLIRKIYKVGLPASLSQVIMSFSFLFLNLIIASFGTVAIATFGIMFRLESIVFMPLVGFMTAVMVMTGHNFGAKKFSRIDQIVMIASKIATAFVIFMGLLFFLFPRFWVSIFVDEVAVISLGVDILKVLPLSYLLLGIAQMIGGAFQGMGKGMFPLIFHATRMFALTIPFAYFVGIVYGAGVIAVAWGFVMSYFIVGSGSILWYVFGGWRKKTFAISQNN
ncbi:MAG: MATE family efflux transporter, partial [Candidatus Woesearchaeota archaeon]